jgi:hypothetical protein
MADDKRCAHGVCDCVVGGDEKYCSEYCENAENLAFLKLAAAVNTLLADRLTTIFRSKSRSIAGLHYPQTVLCKYPAFRTIQK